MESVFVKNMPEATVNRTNQKKKKNKTLREMSQPEFPQSSLSFFFLVFFCFSFKLCKKLSGRTLGRQKDAKSRSWGGGASIYIYIYVIICVNVRYVFLLV